VSDNCFRKAKIRFIYVNYTLGKVLYNKFKLYMFVCEIKNRVGSLHVYNVYNIIWYVVCVRCYVARACALCSTRGKTRDGKTRDTAGGEIVEVRALAAAGSPGWPAGFPGRADATPTWPPPSSSSSSPDPSSHRLLIAAL